MYSFKEKKTHFAALRNPDTARYDLELLATEVPQLPQLVTFSRNPKRYSDDILYALLDCVTRDKIREHRRSKMSKEVEEVSADKKEGDTLPADKSVEELQQSLEETEARAEDAEQRAEEAEQLAEAAVEAQEEAETRAEAAEQSLDEEKKKEQPELKAPVKSKNKKSTRKSTGTTSSTRKSK